VAKHSCILKDVTKFSFIPPSFVPHTKETLEFWDPSRRYQSVDRFSTRLAGKRNLRIAVGCTGGRHRSVAVVEALAGFLENLQIEFTLFHRNIEREVSD